MLHIAQDDLKLSISLLQPRGPGLQAWATASDGKTVILFLFIYLFVEIMSYSVGLGVRELAL